MDYFLSLTAEITAQPEGFAAFHAVVLVKFRRFSLAHPLLAMIVHHGENIMTRIAIGGNESLVPFTKTGP